MIESPGIYRGMLAADYHDDPAPQPALSCSLARCLLDKSPLHVWQSSARLNPAYERREPTSEMDDGTVLHRLLLGDGIEIEEIDAPDWKTKDARARRNEARSNGRTPILSWRLNELKRCADAVQKQLALHMDCRDPFKDGEAETAMFWQEGETWCRSLVDWMPNDPRAPLIDIKATSLSAAPHSWERRLIERYALQAAFYCRGAERLRGVRPAGMLFVVIETCAPYAVSVMSPAPSLMEFAHSEFMEALAIWRACLATNEWPGYPPYTAYVELPGWADNQRQERRLRAEWMSDRPNVVAWNRISTKIMEAHL